MTTRQPARPKGAPRAPRTPKPPTGPNLPQIGQMPPQGPQMPPQVPMDQAVAVMQQVVDALYNPGVFQPSPFQYQQLIMSWMAIRQVVLPDQQQLAAALAAAKELTGDEEGSPNGNGTGPA